MNKKFLRRIGAVVVATALSAGALMMFAGCTTRHPEVTITYTFNGKDYAVDYILSRDDAPQTVTHFIELADAGFYDGTIIHNYTSNFLYGGGYRLVDEDGNDFDYSNDNTQKSFELEEIDYFTTVKGLETEKFHFTQSVWSKAGSKNNPIKGEGLYTVRSEASERIRHEYGREYSHSTGALVMYYSPKSDSFTEEVVIERADGGKNNNGQPLEYQRYIYHSTTSLFYTYTSPNTNSDLGKTNTVFGKAKSYSEQMENGLLAAIRAYIDEHSTDSETNEEGEEIAYSFTESQVVKLNRYEPFQELATEGRDNSEDPFATPMAAPIIIKSVKVTKY